MLDSFWISLGVGSVLGFLAGLGVGGGSLLILWLTLVLDWSPQQAANTNLLFFLPAAAVSTLFRGKAGIRHTPFLCIASGCLCAWMLSKLRYRLDTDLLRKLFGALLLYTGLRELRAP